jgi:hypothetical protein
MANTILSIEHVTTCKKTVSVTVLAVLDNAKASRLDPGSCDPDLCRAVLFLDSLDEWPEDEQDQIAFVTAYDPCWE